MSNKLMEQVYSEYHKDAYQWARQCTGYTNDIAEDVLQSVYLKILSGKASFNNKSSLKTWLFSVIRYTAIDYFRKLKHVESLYLVRNQAMEESEDPIDQEYYRNVLSNLSANQAKVLILVFYHNHTLEAISDIMGLSIGTIRTHYDRGKKRLKEILNKEKMTIYGTGK